MPGKRYAPEQILSQSSEADRLRRQGQTISQIARRLKISKKSLYRWRRKYGATSEEWAAGATTLQAENERLRKIIADQAIEIC